MMQKRKDKNNKKEQKIFANIVNLNLNASIVTLTMNDLHVPIKIMQNQSEGGDLSHIV